MKMSATMVTVLAAAFCALSYTVSASIDDCERGDGFPFELVVTRGTPTTDLTSRSRGVNFTCIDPDTFNRDPIPNAIFWLHDRENPDLREPLNNIPGAQINVERTVLTFRLTPEREGNISCGTEEAGVLRQSCPALIVARPVSGLDLQPQTTFVRAGETAVIPCGIPAGRAREQYRVRWFNGTRGPTLAQLLVPRVDQTESRYFIDPVNFSLIINNVQVTDAGNFYRCGVDVYFPGSQNNFFGPFEYTRTFTLPLKLTVYQPPAITVPPRPQTLSTTQTSTAIFECSARGVPAPTITWTHKDMLAENGTDYRISLPITQEDRDGNFVTSSVFEILNLESTDSGRVRCKAGVAPDDEIGERELPTAIEEVELIVLGSFKNVDVLVSPEKAVIYNIDLKVPITQTFHVFLNYTNEDNGRDYRNRTSTEGYSNAMSITHVEPDFQVPFPRFRVSVGIMVEGRISPLNDLMQSYDINQPTDTSELIRDTVTIAAAAAVPCFIILVAVVAVCILGCILCFYKHNKSPEQRIAKLTRTLNKKLTKTKNLDIETKKLLVQTTYAAFDRIKPPSLPHTTAARSAGSSGHKPAESDGGESGMTLDELQNCECDLLITFIRDSLEQGLRDEKIGADLKRAVEEVLSDYEKELAVSGDSSCQDTNGHTQTYEVVADCNC